MLNIKKISTLCGLQNRLIVSQRASTFLIILSLCFNFQNAILEIDKYKIQ